jgi:hypothetical protein
MRLLWTFFNSPGKVQWATNCVPCGIRNWDFTMISTTTNEGVLAGRCLNFPGQLRVAPWAITTNLVSLLNT